MSHNATLTAIKANPNTICDLLGARRPGPHNRCPFCESSDALSIFLKDAAWLFKCHSCAASGDAVTALATLEKVSTVDAIERLTGEDYTAPVDLWKTRPAVKVEREPEPPVPDEDRIHRVMETALLNVFEGRANDRLKHRGITREWVERNPIIGWIDSARIAKADGGAWTLQNAWVMLVTDPDGRYRAVKGHRENPPEGMQKGVWLGFGTQPADAPRHGFGTLWPCVEWFNDADPLHICEGELKAAALCSAGMAATAPTTGAGFKWTPKQVARMTRRKVVVVFDDDAPGHEFRDRTVAALKSVAASIRPITF